MGAHQNDFRPIFCACSVKSVKGRNVSLIDIVYNSAIGVDLDLEGLIVDIFDLRHHQFPSHFRRNTIHLIQRKLMVILFAHTRCLKQLHHSILGPATNIEVGHGNPALSILLGSIQI